MLHRISIRRPRLRAREPYLVNVLLSPKDTNNKIILEGVEYVYQEGNTLAVVFEDGRARSYPMIQLWYWEQQLTPSRSAIIAIEWGETPNQARVGRADGTSGYLDLTQYPQLKAATPRQRTNWIYDPEKHSVRWPDLALELVF